MLVVQSCLNILPFHGPKPARLLCPRGFVGKNTGVGCHLHSQGSSWPRDWTRLSCTAGRLCAIWVTRDHTYELYLTKNVPQIMPRMFWFLWLLETNGSLYYTNQKEKKLANSAICSNFLLLKLFSFLNIFPLK